MTVSAAIEPSTIAMSRRSLPIIHQAEAAECGLACLAMVAQYHGHDVDLRALRCKFPQSLQGATLKVLMDIASELQLSPRALRFELDVIAELETPCLLHWNMNHFVILKATRGNTATIHDPARGKRVCSLDELEQAVSGVALELTPISDFKPMQERSKLTLNDLWSSIQGLGQSIGIIVGLSLMLQLVLLATPLYLQFVVDEAIPRRDADLLTILAMGFGLLLLFEIATRSLRQLLILTLASRLNLQLATNLINHLLRLPLGYFQSRHLGDIVSRYGSLAAIRQLLSEGLVAIFVDGLFSIVALAAMFVYSPKLTLLTLLISAAYIAARLALFPVTRRRTEETIREDALTQSSLMESIRAMAPIKLHQREGERIGHWQHRLIRTIGAEIGVRKLEIIQSAINTGLFGAGQLLLIYMAAGSVMASLMSVGMLYAFLSYSQRFVQGAENLVEQWIALKMLDMHLERLADIALTPAENRRLQSPPLDIQNNGANHLQIESLSYCHAGMSSALFENVCLDIAPGESVAITGPSGCGKTTFLHCLTGMIVPTHGRIRWGEHDVQHSSSYRASIASVMQDDQLLSGSIADNISFFDTTPDMERVVDAAAAACVHHDIASMPMQYNTLVGEMGASLSGGQKQRICIARALYRQPQILFMDEATSHLDSACEQQLSENISKLPITRILVAHRESTIRSADRQFELPDFTHSG
ncbi:peptidase domain-containing ABC transporter [Halioglobus maricola]|uniref:Peptidase domain-containing ABC transporter n=1 Tax=Halioglobus maricola TaxID=2601894 RepID=A0A5P9NGF2_9GAMM|nr:peptidase domain-containing ABC transporter [Halioglobus maricola]QFU74883.1 peptidase domain-containing ABC transporter [Halioglobus maricola]